MKNRANRHRPPRALHRSCLGWRSAGRRRSPMRARTFACLRSCSATDNVRVSIFVAETAVSASVSLLLFYEFNSLRVIMDLEEQAAAVRLERTVHGPGRTAGIGAGRKALAALAFGIVADGQIALDQVDLFPVFVNKGRGGEDLGRETQEARTAAAPALLVERAGEDLLLYPGRIAGRG